MSSVSISEAPTTGLGRMITDNRFFVPTHQRDYKWDRDRVEKFIDDLLSAIERKDKFYFVGLMVFMRDDDGRLRVLDGQQRLATAIILLSALRSWFGGTEGQSDTASRLQYDFIGRAEYGDSQAQPKLSLNLNNDDNFQKYVVNGSPLDQIRSDLRSTGKTSSNFQLLDAIAYCHERVATQARNANGQVKSHFAELIRFLRDSVIVVRLTVPNESNAFKVFETLNDRGMDLSAIDLIKNHIFGLAYEESPAALKQIEHRWSQITETLKNVKQEDFLKTFWTSRKGIVYLDQIFDDVKTTCRTSHAAKTLSIDMLEASENYAALDIADDPVWLPHSVRTKEIIADLRLLGSKLVKPVMLSALKRMTPHEFERVVWLLETIIVRWQIVREGRPGTIEKQCARVAQLIWKNEITLASDVFKEMSAVYGSDDEFQENFRKCSNSVNSKTLYLLRKIEINERNTQKQASGKELYPPKTLTLEHVLPRNPSEDWQEVIQMDLEIVNDCAERLGNLCLLTDSRNRDVARSGFSRKLDTYRSTELLTTLELGEYDLWDRQAIEHRQAWLASKAVSVWKFQ